jgi:hypothetical protein
MTDRELLQQMLELLNMELPTVINLELNNALQARLAPVPIKGAVLNKHGGVTLCQNGHEESTFGFAGRLFAAAQPAPVQKATVPDGSQDWVGMSGRDAYMMISRHADGWGDVEKMMSQWLAANTPPQRQWVGLTDDEKKEIALEVPIDAVRITEAKLKRKNT